MLLPNFYPLCMCPKATYVFHFLSRNQLLATAYYLLVLTLGGIIPGRGDTALRKKLLYEFELGN